MLKPVNDYVLLELIEQENEKTSSGIYLGENKSEAVAMGKVIASDNKLFKPEMKVLYNKTIGCNYMYKGQKLRLMSGKDIIAIEE